MNSGMATPQAPTPDITREASTGFWRLALTVVAIYITIGVIVGVFVTVRNRDVQNQVDRLERVEKQRRAQIVFLCETVSVIDVLVVQQGQFLNRFVNAAGLTPRQVVLLLRMRDTLDVAHDELADQRACRGTS
jgi:hypothetical protein